METKAASIAANVARVCERIARAAERAGRRPDEITLVAVSKTFPVEAVREAFAAGIRHFGENRVQEWERKQPLLADLDATWHLVGHLQSNKARRAIRLFHTIDSLDSLSLAQRLDAAVAELEGQSGIYPDAVGGSDISAGRKTGLSRSVRPDAVGAPEAFVGAQHAVPAGAPSEAFVGAQHAVPASVRRLVVLLEVRLAPEETKTGIGEKDLPELAEAVVGLPHLDLRGLMTMPPFFDDPEQARPFFRRLRELRDALRRHLAGILRTRAAGQPYHPERSEGSASSLQRDVLQGPDPNSLLPELSMGMSHDFEVAIEEGATQVRLGTALFGPRQAA